MKTRIFLLLLFVLWLVACSPADANTPTEQPVAQLDPTAKPTATLIPTPVPTDTPEPTATPTPEPTATPLPTATPVPTATPRPTATSAPTATLLPPLSNGAPHAMLNIADSFYQDGDFAAAAVIYSEMLLYEMDRASQGTAYALLADTQDHLGEFAAAITNYLQAIEHGFENAIILNALCWDYAITNQPELALPYCEEGIAADPAPYNMDSRGVVYALLGDTEAAIADFRAVVDDLSTATDPELVAIYNERAQWLEALETGENPITPEVLAQLREDSISVVVTPVAKVDVTKQTVREAAEARGYVFEQFTANDGQDVFLGSWMDGMCMAILGLSGPPDGSDLLTRAMFQVSSDCDATTQSNLTAYFLGMLFYQDTAELASGYVWVLSDIEPIINGLATDARPKQIGNMSLSATVKTLEGFPTTLVTVTVEIEPLD